MISSRRFSHSFIRQIFYLVVMVSLTACTLPVSPTPVEGENALPAENSGEGQTIYLPLAQSGNTIANTLPTDPPVEVWPVTGGEIPIMPGAQAGKEEEEKYVFTIAAPLADVEAYYLEALPARGWKTLSIGESMETKNLLFEMGDARLTIYAESLPDLNLIYVVIEG
ncbi:MAG: hypothetical protein Fur0022_06800 [Anaerolineales bacterium]